MRLVVKKNGNIVNEFSFDSGPVYIGRYKYNQVFLPDLSVSRQHAAIFTTLEGKWLVEDMDSANRTFLNGEEIQKSELKTGDVIRISDFTIEVELEASSIEAKPIHLEDTLIPESREVTTSSRQGSPKSEYPRDVIIRKPEVEHAPDIRLPASRIRDFIQATELICRANGIEDLQKTLLNIILGQLKAKHAWCALRDQSDGPMVYQDGKKRNGSTLMLSEIAINQKVTDAIDKTEFLLIPRIPQNSDDKEMIQSAMIAPLIDPSGCFGVLYAANSVKEEYYNLSDLDYLMLLAIHTASIVENF